MGRRRHWAGLAAVSAAAVATLHSPRMADAYQVWVDLNTYTEDREGGGETAESRTAALAGADGVWLITDNSYGDNNTAAAGYQSGIATNTSTGFNTSEWRQIITNIAGPNAQISTEDNPYYGYNGSGAHPDYQSYRDALTIIGTGGATGFKLLDSTEYNETGSLVGGTLLNTASGSGANSYNTEVDTYDATHGGHIGVLTRGYTAGTSWVTNTEAALAYNGSSAGGYGSSRNGSTGFAVTSATFETDSIQGEDVADFLKSVCNPLYNTAGGLVRPAKDAYVLLTKETYRNVPGIYYLKQQAPTEMAGLAATPVRFVLNNDYVTTYNSSTGTDGYGFYGAAGSDTVQGQEALLQALKLAVPVETWSYTGGSGNFSTMSNYAVGPVATPLTAAGAAETSPGQTYDAVAFAGNTGSGVTVAVDVTTAKALAVYFANSSSYTIAGPQKLTLTSYGVLAGGSDGRVPFGAGTIPSAAADGTNSYAPNVIPISVAGTGTNTISAGLALTAPAVGLVVDDQQASSNAFTVTGGIATAGLPITVQGTGTVTLSGAITGGTALAMNGSGVLALGPSASNVGLTLTANAGTTSLAATGTAYAAEAVTDIAAGAVVRPTGTGTYQLNSAYPGANLTINSGGTFDLYGTSAAVTAVAGTSGTITNGGATAATFTTGVGNQSGSFAGSLADGTAALSLTKTGTGTQILTGASTYSGATTIGGGTLDLFNGNNRLPTGTTVTFAATGATLALGAGTTQTVTGLTLGSGVTGVVNGGNGTLAFAGTALNGTSATLNLTAAGGFSFAQSGNTLSVNGNGLTVDLPAGAVGNTITGAGLAVGTGDYGGVSSTTTTLLLGGANAVSVDTLQVGNYHANGVVAFAAGLTNPTLTVRGSAGGTARAATVNVGVNSSGTQGQSGSLDLTGGTVDARVGTLTVASYGANSGAQTTTGTLALAAGTLDATTVILAQSKPVGTGAGGNTVATLNQFGGTVRAATLTFGSIAAASQGTTTESATYNLGTGSAAATLTATTINAGGVTTAAAAAAFVRTLNFANGTLETFNDGAGTTTDLSVAGSAATANGQLNVVLVGTGTHTFLADAGRTITVAPTAVLSGTGGLVTAGTGAVVLSGPNTYAGGTTVSAGTLRANAAAATGTGAVTVNAGGTLGGNGSVGAVAVYGTIDAGAAAGTIGTLTTGAQTWNAGGGLVAETDGTTADHLVLSGLTVTPTGTFTVTPDSTTGGSLTLAKGAVLVLATDSNVSSPSATDPFATSRLVLSAGTVVAASGTTLQLETATDAGGYELLLADVATAPEPTSLLLLATAAAPLALGRRRPPRAAVPTGGGVLSAALRACR